MTVRSELVSTDELGAHLSEWRLFDCRHNILKPELGAQQYAQAHIPGALFAPMETDLCGPKTGRNGRHPLPERDVFAGWIGRQGIRPEDQIVCYDDASGAIAARLWWMLRWAGHQAVAVLDGGLAKWQKESRQVTAETPRFAPTQYRLRKPLQRTLEVSEVAVRLPQLFLLDARAPARFRGEQEPIDPAAGHIPGAKNRFNLDNVRPDGVFKDTAVLRDELRAAIGDVEPSAVVHYCGSGVSACHNLLAMEVAGLNGGTLYVGSWSEWIADPKRPRNP